MIMITINLYGLVAISEHVVKSTIIIFNFDNLSCFVNFFVVFQTRGMRK